MRTSHTFLKLMRKLHLYLGVCITPALLFFAFTGALQTFSFHETLRGSPYKRPAWIVTLGQIHKKQTMTITPKKALPPDAEGGKPKADKVDKPRQPETAAKSHNPLPLKF